MDPILIAVAVMVFLTSSVILLSAHSLKEGHVMIVERFGVFYKILTQPKIYFFVPLFERALEIVDIRVQSKTIKMNQSLDSQESVIYIHFTFQITDPKLFVYATINSQTVLETKLKEAWTKHHDFNKEVFDSLSEIAFSMGIQLIDIHTK